MERRINIKSMCTDKMDGLWVGTAFDGIYYRPKGIKEFIFSILPIKKGCSKPNTLFIITKNYYAGISGKLQGLR